MTERIEPARGAGPLRLIAAGAIALLLFLMLRVELHGFAALILISLLVAIATRIPLEHLVV